MNIFKSYCRSGMLLFTVLAVNFACGHEGIRQQQKQEKKESTEFGFRFTGNEKIDSVFDISSSKHSREALMPYRKEISVYYERAYRAIPWILKDTMFLSLFKRQSSICAYNCYTKDIEALTLPKELNISKDIELLPILMMNFIPAKALLEGIDSISDNKSYNNFLSPDFYQIWYHVVYEQKMIGIVTMSDMRWEPATVKPYGDGGFHPSLYDFDEESSFFPYSQYMKKEFNEIFTNYPVVRLHGYFFFTESGAYFTHRPQNTEAYKVYDEQSLTEQGFGALSKYLSVAMRLRGLRAPNSLTDSELVQEYLKRKAEMRKSQKAAGYKL